MSSFVLRGAWLVLVWVTLWEDASAANLLSGTVLAAGVLLLFPPLRPRTRRRFRPVAAAHLAVYFAWKLLEASAIVAWEVVTPRNRIKEGIVAIPITGVSDGLVTLVANAISLTPGTLTIEAVRDPTVLYVHVLHLRDIEAVRTEVQYLEILALRAFGPEGWQPPPGGPGAAAVFGPSEAARLVTGDEGQADSGGHGPVVGDGPGAGSEVR